MKYIITVDVDEDKLRYESEINDIPEAIMQEAGWLNDSGIYVESVSLADPIDDKFELTDNKELITGATFLSIII